jgi:hypothetical protein
MIPDMNPGRRFGGSVLPVIAATAAESGRNSEY